jgi:uncharacterized protein YbaP (TraB family)
MVWGRRAWIVVAAGGLLVAATVLVRGCAPRHVFMWKATSRGSTVYLLGTLPMKEGDLGTLDPRIKNAFESSDALVLEYRIDVGAQKENIDTVRESMSLPRGDSLSDHVSPAVLAKLTTKVARTGGAMDRVGGLRPFVIAIAILNEEKRRLGYAPTRPLDRHFAEEAEGVKPISYLTNIAQGIEVLTSLNPTAESECLDKALDDTDRMEDFFPSQEKAWRHGTTQLFEEELDFEDRRYPDCNAAIRTAKLKAFLAGIEPLFEAGKTSFVVADAYDLTRSDGIVAVLAARGIQVTQM